MRTFELNKLVHDEIVQGHLDEGGQVDYEVVQGERLQAELERKLEEESAELATAQTDEERAKEQTDIDNVLFALGRLGTADFEPTKTFLKGHYIRRVTMPRTSWLSDYYSKDPIRFPEIKND